MIKGITSTLLCNFWMLGLVVSVLPSVAGALVAQDFYAFQVTDLDGKTRSLGEYRGKVVLVVNTASQCGYPPQYAGLQKIYEKYRDRGLIVLGFPSNDFGSQEPGTNSQIKFFCKSTYSVAFPMFSKGHVSGPERQAVFTWLMARSASHEEIGWNFEKFLLDRNGNVLERFKSDVTPESTALVTRIEKALNSGLGK